MGKLKAILSATILIWFVSAAKFSDAVQRPDHYKHRLEYQKRAVGLRSVWTLLADAISTLCLPFGAARRRSERRPRCRAPICGPLCASL